MLARGFPQTVFRDNLRVVFNVADAAPTAEARFSDLANQSGFNSHDLAFTAEVICVNFNRHEFSGI